MILQETKLATAGRGFTEKGKDDLPGIKGAWSSNRRPKQSRLRDRSDVEDERSTEEVDLARASARTKQFKSAFDAENVDHGDVKAGQQAQGAKLATAGRGRPRKCSWYLPETKGPPNQQPNRQPKHVYGTLPGFRKFSLFKREKEFFSCDLCSIYDTYTEEHLRWHKQNVHPDGLTRKEQTDALYRKAKRMIKYTCKLCGLALEKARDLAYHLTCHKMPELAMVPPPAYGLICKLCNYTDVRTQLMTMHVKQQHTGPMQCAHCTVRYTQKPFLLKHLRAVHKFPKN